MEGRKDRLEGVIRFDRGDNYEQKRPEPDEQQDAQCGVRMPGRVLTAVSM